jgi:hypothetical protein
MTAVTVAWEATEVAAVTAATADWEVTEVDAATAAWEATEVDAASALLEATTEATESTVRVAAGMGTDRPSTTACPVDLATATTSEAASTLVARASVASDLLSPLRGSTKWFSRVRSRSAFMFEL